MKLELRKIQINNVEFGNETKVDGTTLFIDKASLIEDLKKVPNVKEIKIDIAKPGEKTRIIPVKDVIQPRFKVEGASGFAGVTSDVAQLGNGIANVLEGVAVVTIGDIVGFQEGIIDMWGEGAKWTPFSKTNNIVVDISVIDGLTPHEHEETCRIIGLRTSELVGMAAKDLTSDEVEVYEMGDNDEETEKYPNLPKVVYAEMLISQGLLHASYIYGVDSAHILPTLISPNEELDGAVISGNCVAACDKITTYQHQNNAVIKELYKLHGKEINFLGVVLVPEMTTLNGKFVSCDYTAKLCKMLGADGVVVSEEGYGNPDSDLVMICSRLEKQGIKTVLITDECSGWDGMSQPLTDIAKEAVAVVSTGNVSHVVELGKADRVLGDPEAVANIAGGWAGAYNSEDGTMKCELNAVIGATSEIGTHNATVELY
ncbi:MAG: glycine/sarcosine/betaine reductase component B subunit [Peptostreptococcus porci]|uniref:glycine/sarcosine/betaine reductase component B subunit n=1 Tax=Peptostreptococcus porci TaxID=2652282 RepID=UPI0023F21902|nr:glycine/sarcosine/betaine reductase component B subunit [Peptostreptococcus porci]MDD7183197.1 glycine/sarcosine/betaine reductase component B subunit [Peptostreptococcus porci]MDY2793853.1 glycine/sarcosine/betaine reductase component B subunit [Peptostreptococcus porci]MDY4129440.1 glycine/sarcosine/betaine reductase component B subunit [Peptostreptococcus porci]MDY5479603.1 glycine/sarcosine/betaine reductase component B subunit [Peptostreptococcus porci]MDY5964280.1 glycine/sarcosine/be